jgi:hypothetical protein
MFQAGIARIDRQTREVTVYAFPAAFDAGFDSFADAHGRRWEGMDQPLSTRIGRGEHRPRCLDRRSDDLADTVFPVLGHIDKHNRRQWRRHVRSINRRHQGMESEATERTVQRCAQARRGLDWLDAESPCASRHKDGRDRRLFVAALDQTFLVSSLTTSLRGRCCASAATMAPRSWRSNRSISC